MDIKDCIIQHGDVLKVSLWYPRSSEVNKIQVGLFDVRAADDIRIKYDYDRDGWVIKQASIFEWEPDDEECDSDWQEVAFIESWAREKEKE